MPDIVDHQLKRLDHLQSIVQRIAGNCFLLKGWAVTLVSAILGFGVSDAPTSISLSYLGLLPAFLFWGLDGYYLALERKLRGLYNFAAAALCTSSYSNSAPNSLDLSISPDKVSRYDWFSATIHGSTSVVYLVLLGCILLTGTGILPLIVKG
jgi:hypothetical protein